MSRPVRGQHRLYRAAIGLTSSANRPGRLVAAPNQYAVAYARGGLTHSVQAWCFAVRSDANQRYVHYPNPIDLRQVLFYKACQVARTLRHRRNSPSPTGHVRYTIPERMSRLAGHVSEMSGAVRQRGFGPVSPCLRSSRRVRMPRMIHARDAPRARQLGRDVSIPAGHLPCGRVQIVVRTSPFDGDRPDQGMSIQMPLQRIPLPMLAQPIPDSAEPQIPHPPSADTFPPALDKRDESIDIRRR